MLKKIGITNFKAFGKETFLELGELTLLSGVNSSGKSSLYQSLLLFLQSFNETIEIEGCEIQSLNLNEGYLDFGKNEEILYDKENKNITFSFEWDNGIKLKNTYELISLPNRVKIKRFVIKESIYQEITEDDDKKFYFLKRNEDFSYDIKASKILEFKYNTINGIIENSKIDIKGSKKTPIGKGKQKEIELKDEVTFKNIKKVAMFNQMLKSFDIEIDLIEECIDKKSLERFNKKKFRESYENKIIGELKIKERVITLLNAHMFRNKVFLSPNDIYYVPPFRGEPKRLYLKKGGPFRHYIEKMDDLIEYDYNLERKEVVSGTLKKALEYWLIEKLQIGEEILIKEVVGEYGIEVLIRINGKLLPITGVGYGVSQVAPVIYSVLANRQEIIILDEPEIHLHPKIQSDLAEFFFKISKLKKTLLIETHSEYIIEKLIYLKVKYNVSSQIKMIWVEKGEEGAKLTEIEHDNLGYINNAPKFFLSEREKMLEELSELRMERI